MQKLRGRVWKFGDNIDTDQIYPARYMVSTEDLAKHAMEDADPNFSSRVQPGDIIVAGQYFGCGSSREYAPLALKCAGVALVIAESFSRIFFRNCINIGLPVMTAMLCDKVEDGQIIECDLESGSIIIESTGEEIIGSQIPSFLQEILEHGGLMNSLKIRYANQFSQSRVKEELE